MAHGRARQPLFRHDELVQRSRQRVAAARGLLDRSHATVLSARQLLTELQTSSGVLATTERYFEGEDLGEFGLSPAARPTAASAGVPGWTSLM
jgi:hypothetical protein